MLLYATPRQADDLALDAGVLDFYMSDRRGRAFTSGVVASTATNAPLVAITPAGCINTHDLIETPAGELIRIMDMTYTTSNKTTADILTMTRGLYGTTATDISDGALLVIRSPAKINLLWLATQDIVSYHGQAGSDLWMAGSPLLRRACVIQALYLYHTIDARKIAEYIRAVSAGSYSDTVLSVSQAADRRLAPDARALIDEAMVQAGVSVGEYQRA